MKCPRCKKEMTEQKRSFHKQRKWICHHCGQVRFQQKKKPRSAQDGEES